MRCDLTYIHHVVFPRVQTARANHRVVQPAMNTSTCNAEEHTSAEAAPLRVCGRGTARPLYTAAYARFVTTILNPVLKYPFCMPACLLLIVAIILTYFHHCTLHKFCWAAAVAGGVVFLLASSFSSSRRVSSDYFLIV